MLQVNVITLFPGMFDGVLGDSILKRAVANGLVSIRCINFRDFSTNRHKTVDDYPFGGGAGMLLKPEPIFEAMAAVKEGVDANSAHRIILLTPQGKPFNQSLARDYAAADTLSFICGHYEGFDERVRQHIATDEVSIGDFILTGGEIGAMAIVDAVVRLLPGALGNDGSAEDDSFSDGLLEFPQYTRPADYCGMAVPATLLSGNHAEIAKWRRRHSLYRTWRRRPDLLKRARLNEDDRSLLRKWGRGDFSGIDVLE